MNSCVFAVTCLRNPPDFFPRSSDRSAKLEPPFLSGACNRESATSSSNVSVCLMVFGSADLDPKSVLA